MTYYIDMADYDICVQLQIHSVMHCFICLQQLLLAYSFSLHCYCCYFHSLMFLLSFKSIVQL